jgi:hypothetical protein
MFSLASPSSLAMPKSAILNYSHAAAADDSEDLEVGEGGNHGLERRRCGFVAGRQASLSGGNRRGQEAFGTKTFRRFQGQGGLAFRTVIGSRFSFHVTGFLTKWPAQVTTNEKNE